MGLLKKLLNKINGLHYQQEYLCLAEESFSPSPLLYLTNDNRIIIDITKLHLFVGYHPLVIALSSTLTGISPEQQLIHILLSHESYQPNDFPAKKDAIARISLKKVHEVAVDNDRFLFFEGISGNHQFVSAFHQFIIQLNNRLYNKKPGNVFLENNLYKQVQIAYALPRRICLVTVGENDLYNLFPTDLHGRINDRYIISLRHEGNACRQVLSSKRIVLSDMPVNAYKKVYALGKNHMQPLKEKSNFDFSHGFSKNLHLPLPKELLSYKELELEYSFMYGIHYLLILKIVYYEKIADIPETLAHIHNCYATWRYKKQISSNLFLR